MDNDYIIQLITKLDGSKTADDLKKIEQQLNAKGINLKTSLDTATSKQQLQELAKQLQSVLKSSGLEIDTSKIMSAFSQVTKETDKLAQNVNKIQLSIDDKSYEAEIAKITKGFTALSGDANEAKIHVEELNKAYLKMVNATDDNSRLQAEKNYQLVLAKTKNELVIAQAKAKEYVDALKVSKLRNDIQDWLKKNTAATKEAKDAMQVYLSMLDDVAHVSQVDFNTVKSGFDDWDTAMRKAGNLGKSLTETFKEGAKSFIEWSTASGAVMKVVYALKDAVSELKEVDTLLTEISKANDKLSVSDLAEIGDNSFDVASKYGKDATDYLSGVQEASRAGYDDAEGIAELSVALQGAGDMTDELASSYIIATDKAYKLNGSVEALKSVLDGANKITNENAVNMTELAEGMSVVGSQAASSQMSVEETTAAIATLVAVTQNGGSEMGNAFKGILMNLRQVTGEVEDGGDAIDESSLTKYEKACEELGVSLTTVKDGVVSLKEPMQILKELSVEYQKLDESDARRANLLSAVGGKYRANALNAILENYDLYEKMLQDYAKGNNSMAIEAEKTAQSWEGSSKRLKNTWVDTVENVANSDAIITLINSFNSLLTVINNVTEALGSFGTISTVGAGILSANGLGLTNYVTSHSLRVPFYKVA